MLTITLESGMMRRARCRSERAAGTSLFRWEGDGDGNVRGGNGNAFEKNIYQRMSTKTYSAPIWGSH